MDIFGLNIQELLMLGVIAAFITVHIIALRRLWRKDYSFIHKVVWTIATMSMPGLGAFLYYWFNEKA